MKGLWAFFRVFKWNCFGHKSQCQVAKSLQRKLDAPGAVDSVPFASGKIKVLEINIQKNCPLVNIELGNLTKQFPDLKANILGVIRGDKFIILKMNNLIFFRI